MPQKKTLVSDQFFSLNDALAIQKGVRDEVLGAKPDYQGPIVEIEATPHGYRLWAIKTVGVR